MMDTLKPKDEYTLLSYLVHYAERARDILTRALISDGAFTDDARRTAFHELMASKATDEFSLLGIVARNIPDLEDSKRLEAFSALSANSGALEYEAEKFSHQAIARDALQEINASARGCNGENATVFLGNAKRLIDDAQAKFDAVTAAFSGGEADAGDASAAPTIDESLLHVPGFVDDLVACSMQAAPHPSRTLSFAGALAMLAHLAGRRFIGPYRARPNLYLIALAHSGVGKNYPRILNRNIAQNARIEVSIKDAIGSPEGVEDALVRTPTLLMQIDEFDTMLSALKDKKNVKANEATWSGLLKLFTSSDTNVTTRTKAESNRGGGDKIIYNPSLSIFGTAIPFKFYGALCERALDSGFLARCLVLEASSRSKMNMTSDAADTLPQSITIMVDNIMRIGRNHDDNRPIDNRDLVRVPFSDKEAEAAAQRVVDETEDLYKKAEKAKDEMVMSIWTRSFELSMKLALLYAISEDLKKNPYCYPTVSCDAVEWAWRFVKTLQLRMIVMAHEHTAETQFEENYKKALRFIKGGGRTGVTRSDLTREMRRIPVWQVDDIVDYLRDSRLITIASLPQSGNGKSATVYIAVRGKATKGA